MSQLLFELGINLIETFIITAFLTLYLEPKFGKGKAILFFIISWLANFGEICIVNHITIFESVGSYIPICMYFIYAILCLKGNVLLKLWISILTQIIVTMIAVLGNLGVCYIIDYTPLDMITVFNRTRVIAVIMCQVLLVVTYAVVLRNRYKNPIKTKLWYALIIIPLFSVVSITSIMKVTLTYPDTIGFVLLGVLCIIFANILTYYFYTVISKEYENKLKIQLLEQQYDNAKTNIESATAFVNQMRSVKHDIKNHLLTLSGYIKNDRGFEAVDYINKLTNDYFPSVQGIVETGNIAFDAIVNSKVAVCGSKGIFVEINIEEKRTPGLADTDTSILFGNLFDNAIEAVENSEMKHISLAIRKKGEYISILMNNSIDESVLAGNPMLETTKENKELHGIGLNSIRAIVEKYDGMLQFYEENNEFCCDILIPIL